MDRYEAGKYDEALVIISKLDEMVRQSINCELLVANIQFRRKDYTKALESFNFCASDNPSERGIEPCSFFILRGLSYLYAGKTDSAFLDLRNALQYLTDYSKGEVYYNLACVYTKTNDISTALVCVDSSLMYSPSGLTAMYHDVDLFSIRNNPGFISIIKKYGLLPSDSLVLPVVK